MYVISGARGSGKTYRLLELANESKGVVISSNPNAMREKARSWGFTEIADFVSPRDSASYYFTKPLYIDNLEKFVQEVLASGSKLTAYTYTVEE